MGIYFISTSVISLATTRWEADFICCCDSCTLYSSLIVTDMRRKNSVSSVKRRRSSSHLHLPMFLAVWKAPNLLHFHPYVARYAYVVSCLNMQVIYCCAVLGLQCFTWRSSTLHHVISANAFNWQCVELSLRGSNSLLINCLRRSSWASGKIGHKLYAQIINASEGDERSWGKCQVPGIDPFISEYKDDSGLQNSLPLNKYLL